MKSYRMQARGLLCAVFLAALVAGSPVAGQVTAGTPRPEAGAARSGMEAMQVACAQIPTTVDINANARTIVEVLEAESELGTRLVAFPELILTDGKPDFIRKLAQPQIDAALAIIRAGCRRFDIYAVVGSVDMRDGKRYNVAYVIGPQGQIVKRYAKMHAIDHRLYEDGQELAIFRVDDVPMTIMICHDERYPEIVRIPVVAGARVCIYISYESKTRDKWDNYRSQIMARAVENQISVVHANAGDGGFGGGSHGHSRIIDPNGKILAEAGTEIGETIRAVIHPNKSSNRYALFGAASPALRQFWAEGLRVLKEQNPEFFASQLSTQPAPSG
jgi:predicted amidohydrolase